MVPGLLRENFAQTLRWLCLWESPSGQPPCVSVFDKFFALQKIKDNGQIFFASDQRRFHFAHVLARIETKNNNVFLQCLCPCFHKSSDRSSTAVRRPVRPIAITVKTNPKMARPLHLVHFAAINASYLCTWKMGGNRSREKPKCDGDRQMFLVAILLVFLLSSLSSSRVSLTKSSSSFCGKPWPGSSSLYFGSLKSRALLGVERDILSSPLSWPSMFLRKDGENSEKEDKLSPLKSSLCSLFVDSIIQDDSRDVFGVIDSLSQRSPPTESKDEGNVGVDPRGDSIFISSENAL